MKAITANPRTGWARADEVSGPEVIAELTRLSSENARLRKDLEALQQVQKGRNEEVRVAIRVLSKNARRLRVRTTNKWDAATPFTCSLADMFHCTAPSLISESSTEQIADRIALRLNGKAFFRPWPIGQNIISEIIADLAALNLVEPSKKKHSVKDSSDYWSLTEFGKEVLREFRRVRLEEGLASDTSDEPAG